MHGHHPSHANPVTLYTLPTVNIVRKYSFFLDAIVTLLSGAVDAIKDGIGGMGKKKSGGRDKASERVMFGERCVSVLEGEECDGGRA